VAHPSVAYIHCIAVRPGRTHKVASPKIKSYQGDLYQGQFGLDDATARVIFSTVAAVIHNGAEVSHMKSYHSLRTPNVLSTKELLRLSVEHGVGEIPRFHYVSSAGVGHLVPAPSSSDPNAIDAFPPISLANYPPPRDGSNGYVAAKWASEMTLERAAAIIPGFGAVVHRPSNITGTGVGENDIVHSLLRFSAALKAVPQMTAATGAFDFISLEACARDIVRGVVDDNAAVVGTVRYEHRSGEIIVPVGELGGFLAAKSGIKRELEVLSWGNWVNRALEIGLDPLVGEFLKELDGRMRMPLLVAEES
jgi:pseurotin A synthetase (hybrid polyketide synthase/nonribosomal peptide synthetase)